MIIKELISLSQFSTYKIGGPARFFCEIENEDDLREAIAFARDNKLQILVLGGQSNLLISDNGFDGLVIKIKASSFKLQASRIEVGAGISMPGLVERTTKAGLAGLEWAGGLPGSLGGAIFGNAGCFGHEIKEVIQTVKALKITNESPEKLQVISYKLQDCGFSYRNSKFKRGGDWIILSAVLKLEKGDPEELQKFAKEKIDYRKSRHPLEYPNIGSIFKNIDEPEKVKNIIERFPELKDDVEQKWHGKVPTAVLIEKAGLAGKQIGGAQISEKHANFIINKGNAKAQDVVALIKEIKSKVKELFGIELEEEVRYVGFD